MRSSNQCVACLHRRTAVALAALVVAATFRLAAQPAGGRFDELDALVGQELRRTNAPGAAVVVVEGDAVVFSRGYGLASVETQAPVTPDTLFQIGSITKTFTAATVLSAAQAGAGPALESPVGAVVPEITACLRSVTLGQLLSHTGGLLDEPAEFGTQGEDALASYVRSWSAEYCLLPPGRAFSYSNSGYALAGAALEAHQRTPFADLVQSRVLSPLGMTRTTFRPTVAMTYPLAVGHRTRGDVTEVVRPLPNDTRLWPAGTLYSSASDMGRLVRALLNEGRLGTTQAIPAATVRALLAPAANVPTVGLDYGYGLELDTFQGAGRAGHAGSMTGYAAMLSMIPSRRIGVVVMTNGDNALLSAVAERALTLSMGTTRTPAASTRTPDVAPPPTTLDLDAYVGTYTNPRRFTVEVRREADALVLHRFGRAFPMRASSRQRFIVDRPGGGEEVIAFGLAATGRADYLQMNIWALARKP